MADPQARFDRWMGRNTVGRSCMACRTAPGAGALVDARLTIAGYLNGGGSPHSWLTIHPVTIRHGSRTRDGKILGWLNHAMPKAHGVIPRDGSHSGSGSAGWRGSAHSPVREKLIVTRP
jgi:hypothetical protein